MKVYVANKFEEKARTREVMYELVEAGHSITYDWTSQEQNSTAQAVADIRGVLDADILVAIFEQPVAFCGALVEFGAALAAGKPIYVLGSQLDARLLFLRHPNVHQGSAAYQKDLITPHV